MLEFQARQQWKKRLYSKPAFLALLVLTVLSARGAWSVYSKQNESRETLKEVVAEVEALRVREADLAAQIARLQTDQGVEEEIRKRFSVVRDGEQMVVLVDEQATVSPEMEEEVGFFRRTWSKVKGVFSDGEEEGKVEIVGVEEE